MDTVNIGIFTAFIAGIISFASPCVLPIVPGYLSFITGLGLDDLTKAENRRGIIRLALSNSVAFVIGFSIIFILLGASATTIGSLLRDNLSIISKIAGVLISILGFHMIGWIKIPFLLYEKRIHKDGKSVGLTRSAMTGSLFALGWTPCIGPILAGILSIAALQGTVGKGILLLSFYSLGLGIPFIASALFLNGFFATFKKFKMHLHKVEVTGGVILLIIGILMLTGNMAVVSQKLEFMNPEQLLVSNDAGTKPEQTDQTSSPTTTENSTGAETSGSSGQPEPASRANYGSYEFSLTTLTGKSLKLSDYSNKVVLVNIWAPWCGPCKMETPGFINLYKNYHERGFEIISVAVQTDESQVRDFLQKYNLPWPVGIDDAIAEQYRTYGLPDNFLFGPDGTLLEHFIGFTDENRLKPLIEKSLR